MNIGRVMIGADIKDFLEKYSFTLTKNYLMTSKGSIASLQDDPYFKIIENAKINCRTVEEERLQTPLNERDGVNLQYLWLLQRRGRYLEKIHYQRYILLQI